MVEDDVVALVYSEAYIYMEPEDKIIKEYGERSYEGYMFDELVRRNFIVAPGVLIDADKVKEVGGFNERILIEDWDLWLRLSQRYKVAYVKEHLVYYRRHNKNTSTASNLSFLKSVLEVLDQYNGHKHYRESGDRAMKELIYNSIVVDPSIDTLKLVMKNFQFRPFYFKQGAKILFALLKRRLKKGLK
jgi:GT2 family glycosyltransferase